MKNLMKTAAVVGVLLLWIFPAPGPAQDCGPYVTVNGSVFTVEPNGVDDTENIQCAFDAAIAAGPSSVVQLVEGTYYIGQIVVNDFVGTFRGAGMDGSVLTNLPTIYVASDPFETPGGPSAENPWPSLLAFVGGDFLVSDLGVRVTGPPATTGWFYFGFGPVYELAHAFVILGESANASFYRVLVEGEEAENTVFGLNVISGIFYEGFIFNGESYPPISGSFAVHDSVFRTLAGGTPLANLSEASVVISRNLLAVGELGFGMDAGDLTNTTFEFSHNTVVGFLGVDLYDGPDQEYGATSAKLLFKNNLFSGVYGVLVESTFSGDTECLLLGNNTHKVSDLGVFLGEGTSQCTVVGGKAKTTVLDLGTDNTLVGVNNMGTGVGPTIRSFLRRTRRP